MGGKVFLNRVKFRVYAQTSQRNQRLVAEIIRRPDSNGGRAAGFPDRLNSRRQGQTSPVVKTEGRGRVFPGKPGLTGKRGDDESREKISHLG